MGNVGKWTTGEVEYLVDHYRADGPQNVADALGRTKDSVQQKAFDLFISRPMMARWTPEEDELLRELAGDGWSATEVAAHIGRTYWAVVSRAKKLGVRFSGKPGRPPDGGVSMTSEEGMALRECVASGWTVEDTAEELGWSVTKTAQKAAAMKLRFKLREGS